MVVQSSGALGGLRQQIFGEILISRRIPCMTNKRLTRTKKKAQLYFVYTESSNLEIITTRSEATRENGRLPRRFSAKVVDLETRQVILETVRAGSPSTALDLLLELTSSMVKEMLNAGPEANMLEEQADEPLAIEPAQKRKKKSKRHSESNLEVAVVEEEQLDDEPAPEPGKKKKRSKKVVEPDLQTAEFNADLNRSRVEQEAHEELREQSSTKGRKKQSKKREEATIETNNVNAEHPMAEPEEEPVREPRKKKSKARVEPAPQDDDAEVEQFDPEPEPELEQQPFPESGRKKRKRKSERDEPPPDASAADTEQQSVQKPRRKKRKRAADVDPVQEEIEEQPPPNSRKNKTKKREEAIPEAIHLQAEQPTEEPQEESKSYKKQSKRNEKPSQAADAATDAEVVSETGKKKAKKTKKEAESSSMEQHDGSTTVGAPHVGETEQNEADRQAAKKERSKERRRQRQVAAAQASEAVTVEVALSDPSKPLNETDHGQRINAVVLPPEAGNSEQEVQHQITHAVTELPSSGSQPGRIYQDDSHTQISNAERQEEPEQDDRVAFVPVHNYDHVHPDRQRLASCPTGYMMSGGSGDSATSTQPPKTTRHRTIAPSDRVVPNDHSAASNNRPWDRANRRHEDSRRDIRPRPYEMGDYYRPNYGRPSSPSRRYRGSLSKRDEEEQYGRVIRTSPVYDQHSANSWRVESSERRPNIKVESDEDSYEVEPASDLRDPETEARLQELTVGHNRIMALREQVAQANKRTEQAVQELKEAEKGFFIIDDSMIDPRVLAMDNDKRSGSL